MVQTPPSDDSTPSHGWENLSPGEVAEIIARRAVVEQAKGILMFVFETDADTAFEMLRRRSRTTRVKMTLLAAQFTIDVLALTPDERLDMRAACANVLLTTHRRIDPSAEGG